MERAERRHRDHKHAGRRARRGFVSGNPRTSFYFLPLRCEFCGRDNSDDDDRCDCPPLEEESDGR